MTSATATGKHETPAPDRDIPAYQLRPGHDVEHYGERCTVTEQRPAHRAGHVWVALSNGRTGEIPSNQPIGVYDNTAPRRPTLVDVIRACRESLHISTRTSRRADCDGHPL